MSPVSDLIALWEEYLFIEEGHFKGLNRKLNTSQNCCSYRAINQELVTLFFSRSDKLACAGINGLSQELNRCCLALIKAANDLYVIIFCLHRPVK